MQGKKTCQEKLFNNFHLSDRVPATNFYRRLKDVLHLDFFYKDTKQYYGDSGQKSIDPLVFFKLCLVGYLENIISDRKLIAHASMRLDILYFLGYDIDEELPWHSTISRTRQLFPEEVFEKVFTHVFEMYVDQGMVKGSTQAIDSAPVKANASMDSLELKVPQQDLEAYLSDVRYISNRDKDTYRKAKDNKANKEQRQITASDKELKEIKSRNKNWSENQNQRPGAGNKGSRYTSNKTHYSPTDPDARISIKPGKARKLNYHSQLSVDKSHHVITDIKAYHADGKDNQDLPDIVDRLSKRLWRSGFRLENILADTGYSRAEYERNKQRLKTEKGRRMKVRRQATVEPVFATLTQFMGLRKINTIGIRQANKVMHLSAVAYNLKKYLKFTKKLVQSGAGGVRIAKIIKNSLVDLPRLKIGAPNLQPTLLT